MNAEERESYIFELYRHACELGAGLDYSARLAEAILKRCEAGRSMDCDEYRALLKAAGRPS